MRAAALPLAPIFVASLVPELRPLALAFIVAGFLVQWRRGSPDAWPWAAATPVAAMLSWSLLPAPAALPGAGSCADPASPVALWRAAELVVVLGLVALLARSLGAGRGHLPLSRPAGWFLTLSIAAGFLFAPVALLLVQEVVRPFFGTMELQIGLVGALLPALVFAVANGTLEETAYRGVLQRWTEPHFGTVGAIVVQAAAFSVAHTGRDFVGSPLPVVAAVFVLAVVGGIVVKRTGSLAVPIVVHVALDIPLYYGLACRLS